MKRVMLFLSCILSVFLINAGFPGDTLVNTSQGLFSIQSLQVGDSVVCLDENLNLTEKPITAIALERVDEIIKIILEDDITFYVSKNNKIYVPVTKQWICAGELRPADLLLTKNFTKIKIKEIAAQSEPITIFSISIDEYHNFCITEDGILVHNMNVLIDWIAENGSIIWANAQNTLIQAGTAAVLYFSTNENQNSNVQPNEMPDLEKQLLADQLTASKPVSENSIDDVTEPAYTYVCQEGWVNNGTWWACVGTMLYTECCTIGADGITILYYDLVRDAQITKDLQQKYAAQKQKAVHKQFSSSVSGTKNDDPDKHCWCKCHPSNVGCGCTCQCICSKKNKSFENKYGYTYANGFYEGVKYHHGNSTGNSKGGKSPAPKDGQRGLDQSIPLSETSSRRVGVSEGQIIVFDRTSKGACPFSKNLFHGHVRTWEEIKSDKNFDSIVNALKDAGFLSNKGKVLK